MQNTDAVPVTTGEGAPAYAATLTGNGYAPVPLKPNEKHPNVKGWPSRSFAPADFNAPGAGVGVKLGAVVAIDADTKTAELSAAALGAIVEATGIPADRLVIRRGTGEARRHKFATLFRFEGEAPTRKRGRSAAYGAGGFVEFLANGQLAVRAVIDGADAYAWTNPGRDPGAVPAAELPTIDAATLAHVRALFEARADAIATRTEPGTDTAAPKGTRVDPTTLGGTVGLICGAITCEEALTLCGATWVPTEDGERYALVGEGGAPGAYVDPDDPTRFWSHYHDRNFNAHELLVEFADGADVPPVAEADTADVTARGRREWAALRLAHDTWEAFRSALAEGFPVADPDAAGNDGSTARKRYAEEVARGARYARAAEVRAEVAEASARVETALKARETDPDAEVDEAALWSALALVAAERPAEAERFMKRAKKALNLPIGVIRAETRKARTDAADEVEGDDIGARLVEMARERGELFTGEDDRGAYFTGCLDHVDPATLGPARTYELDSTEFVRTLRGLYYRSLGKVPGAQTLKDAAATLAALATMPEAPTHRVHLRAAPVTDGSGDTVAYAIDLGDDTHRAIVVSAGGVEVVDRSPVRFRRSARMRALPAPDMGGTVEDFRAIVNVADEDVPALVGAMLDAWRPDSAYPIVELVGELGSGKSAVTKAIKNLLDPNGITLRTAPREAGDITATARANHVVAYDNLSRLPADLQDMLCSLSTGGGTARRALYTDADESAIDVQRSVILNGIHGLATAPDLVSRVVKITCPRFGPDHRQMEDTALRALHAERTPKALGFLLSTFAAALAILDEVEVGTFRMLSYARLAEAVSQVLGRPPGAFAAAYAERIDEVDGSALDGMPAAHVLAELVEAGIDAAAAGPREAPTDGWGYVPDPEPFQPDGSGRVWWEGTMGDLLARLNRRAPRDLAPGWPATPQRLGDHLERARSGLRRRGIEFDKAPGASRRRGTIYRFTAVIPAGAGVTPAADGSAGVIPAGAGATDADDDEW